jgi:thiamine biosynthesis lipoprotein
MGTEVELFVDAERSGRALDAAEAEIHRLEAVFSRFRDSSELCLLNRTGSIVPSVDLRQVVEHALAAREETAGRFDPTVHEALVAAGYDRTFEQVPADDPRPSSSARCGGEVRVGDRIELEPGVRLDLGGIAKGYAAERAAELLAFEGRSLVNAGGDIAVRGGAWPVGVETTAGTLTLELLGGGLATSGMDRRRWRRGERDLHHVVDPATGEPGETDLVRVTVVAGNTVEAEVWAKALLLVGVDAATAEADDRGLPSILVNTNGQTLAAGGLG